MPRHATEKVGIIGKIWSKHWPASKIHYKHTQLHDDILQDLQFQKLHKNYTLNTASDVLRRVLPVDGTFTGRCLAVKHSPHENGIAAEESSSRNFNQAYSMYRQVSNQNMQFSNEILAYDISSMLLVVFTRFVLFNGLIHLVCKSTTQS